MLPHSVPVAAAAAAAAAVTSASAGTPMGDLSFPPYWTPKVAEVDLVDVDLKSDEAKDVLKTFHSTINRKACGLLSAWLTVIPPLRPLHQRIFSEASSRSSNVYAFGYDMHLMMH